MNRMTNRYLVLVAALAFIGLAAGIASGATVASAFTYQGTLTDPSGNPLTGTYSMTFRIYDFSTGGGAISTDTHNVAVTDGKFTTVVAITDPSNIIGEAVWLGIRVGSDPEMTPRQEILPVPYAISLRPGVVTTGSFPNQAIIKLHNDGAGGDGLMASTMGTQSKAVYGLSGGPDSKALYGLALDERSQGVYGESDLNTGIYGIGKEGGFFTTNQGGTNWETNRRPAVNISTRYAVNPGITAKTIGPTSPGVYSETSGGNSQGFVTSTSGDGSPGVHSVTSGKNSAGILVSTTGESSNGIRIQTTNEMSSGIYAKTENDYSIGVQIKTSGHYAEGVNAVTYGDFSNGLQSLTYGDHSDGILAFTDGDGSDGVRSHSFGTNADAIDAVSEKGIAIYADTYKTDHKWGVYTEDYIYAGGIQTPAVDLAEYLPVAGDLPPGTVLVIGPEGILQASTTAHDTRVAGIISTSPAIALGTDPEGNPGEEVVAISGRVPCRVDAGSGAIRPGDLLTTSDTPGHAMKAEPTIINGRGFYPDGTVLGKAMGTLESGTGTIEVLVTLQ